MPTDHGIRMETPCPADEADRTTDDHARALGMVRLDENLTVRVDAVVSTEDRSSVCGDKCAIGLCNGRTGEVQKSAAEVLRLLAEARERETADADPRPHLAEALAAHRQGRFTDAAAHFGDAVDAMFAIYKRSGGET